MSEQQAKYRTVAEDNFKTRLLKEEKQARERLEKLQPFILSEKFKELDPVEARLLLIQFPAMSTYHQVLVARLELILSVEELKEFSKGQM